MIKSIAAGWSTTFCITEEGRLYAAGDNKNQQLGFATINKHPHVSTDHRFSGKQESDKSGCR